MAPVRLKLSDYLQPGQAYHYARVELAHGVPPRLHGHDFYELFWMFRGDAIHHVGGEEAHLAEGSLAFIRPDDVHRLLASSDRQPVIAVNIAMPATTIESMGDRFVDVLADRFFWTRYGSPTVLTPRDYPERLLRELIGRLARSPRSALALEAFLAALFSGLENAQPSLGDGMPPWLVDLCHKANDPNLFKLGAAGLIGASGRSHSYVCRAFERHLETSPSAFINRVRMRHAARRLIETQDAIAQIAEDCGLQNISHFYSVFAREHQMTPAAFRRERRRDPTRPVN